MNTESDLPLSVGTLVVPRFHEFNDADRLAQESKALVITDGVSFAEASERLAVIRALKESLAKEKKHYLQPFNDGITRLRDWFKPAEDALAQAELATNREMSRFALEDHRRKKAAEAEAEAQAEAERQRLRKAAQKAEEKGDTMKAEALAGLAAVGVQAAPVAPRAVSEAVSGRIVHKGRVTSLMTLVKAIAAGQAPLTIIEVNEGALNKIIEATKGEVGYPGVEIYQETQFRRKK